MQSTLPRLALNQSLLEESLQREAGLSPINFSGFPTRHVTEQIHISFVEKSSVGPKVSAKLSLAHDSWKKFPSQISVSMQALPGLVKEEGKGKGNEDAQISDVRGRRSKGGSDGEN